MIDSAQNEADDPRPPAHNAGEGGWRIAVRTLRFVGKALVVLLGLCADILVLFFYTMERFERHATIRWNDGRPRGTKARRVPPKAKKPKFNYLGGRSRKKN